MKVVNKNSKKEIATNVEIADRLFSRMKGLLGRDELPAGEALVITPCNSVHTFGMRFPIDVIFLDKRNKVVGCARNLQPNRLSRMVFSARSVLEAPAGTIDRTSTKIGDDVEIV